MTPSELLAFYKSESPLEIELAGRRHVLPMSNIFDEKDSAGAGIFCQKMDSGFHVDEGLGAYVNPVKQRLEKDSNFTDGIVVRICSHDGGRIGLQPASYLEGVATNFFMDDIPPGRTRTLRQWLHGKRKCFQSFESSRLVNHIGIVCMVETVDGMLVVQNRSRQVANRADTLSSSISGALNWDDIQNHGQSFPIASVGCAAIREGKEELGVALEHAVFLGMFREFIRGGKPEAYFYSRIKEPFQSILDRREYNAGGGAESSRLHGYRFLSDEMSKDPESAEEFEMRAKRVLESVSSRANLTLRAGILLTASYLSKGIAAGIKRETNV